MREKHFLLEIQVAERDPVNTINVPAYLKVRLSEAQAAHGEGLAQAFGRLDQEIQKSVQALMAAEV